ncbi:MAG: hypothetical protein ACLKAK_07715 [Alkaliphilus sp.]
MNIKTKTNKMKKVLLISSLYDNIELGAVYEEIYNKDYDYALREAYDSEGSNY